jgi:SH3-like domain-containing protein
MLSRPFTVLPIALLLLSAPASAQDRELPYWASIRAEEVNMRVGPSERYKIDWIYKRQGLPVKVVRLKDGWRLVQDHEGTQGWIISRLLDPKRMAMVTQGEPVAIRAEPGEGSQLRWKAEAGVIGDLGDCEAGWCEFDVAGRSGWVWQERLWGAGEP